jgi:hypothetical protein
MNLGVNWIDFVYPKHEYPLFRMRIIIQLHLGVSRLKHLKTSCQIHISQR